MLLDEGTEGKVIGIVLVLVWIILFFENGKR